MTDTNLPSAAPSDSLLIDPGRCACFNLRRAARRVTQAYDAALKPAGMQATQFTLLAMLSEIGRDGLRVSDMAEQLGMDRTTLTRNLSLTDRHGWTEARPGTDRRERLIFLQPAGEAALTAALPYWREAQRAFTDEFGRDDLAALLELTRRIGPG